MGAVDPDEGVPRPFPFAASFDAFICATWFVRAAISVRSCFSPADSFWVESFDFLGCLSRWGATSGSSRNAEAKAAIVLARLDVGPVLSLALGFSCTPVAPSVVDSRLSLSVFPLANRYCSSTLFTVSSTTFRVPVSASRWSCM